MTKIAEINAETTVKEIGCDITSNLLRSMQISGGVLLNEHYLAPWAISIPSHETLAEKLMNNPRVHVAAFHLVQRGSIDIELANGERHTLFEGELAIVYSGQAHTIYQGSKAQVYPFETLMETGINIFMPAVEKESQSVCLLCGAFQLHNTIRNPLFEALPPLLKLSARHRGESVHPSIKTLINSLLSELNYPSYAHEYIVGRYLELLCAHSVGDYIESNQDNGRGWLHAVKNPMAAKVISAIHAQPEYPWSVNAMAKLCHLSPSRFAARFSQILGMSPMMYVTQCRMYIASTLLTLPQSSIEKITLTMGYENVAAFSRAFKRTMGISPGLWRKINQPQESSAYNGVGTLCYGYLSAHRTK